MRYLFFYFGTIIVVNYAFATIPLLSLPNGDLWSPVALIVGFTFVIRDFAQKETGHWVIVAMLVGGFISWFMASKEIAIASVCAFLVGEFFDWLVYTCTRKPFSQRILLSSAIGTPLDSIVFMSMVGLFSIPSVVVMTASKMAGAVAVFFLYRHRERKLHI